MYSTLLSSALLGSAPAPAPTATTATTTMTTRRGALVAWFEAERVAVLVLKASFAAGNQQVPVRATAGLKTNPQNPKTFQP